MIVNALFREYRSRDPASVYSYIINLILRGIFSLAPFKEILDYARNIILLLITGRLNWN